MIPSRRRPWATSAGMLTARTIPEFPSWKTVRRGDSCGRRDGTHGSWRSTAVGCGYTSLMTASPSHATRCTMLTGRSMRAA